MAMELEATLNRMLRFLMAGAQWGPPSGCRLAGKQRGTGRWAGQHWGLLHAWTTHKQGSGYRIRGQHRRGCARGAGVDGPSALLGAESRGFTRAVMRRGWTPEARVLGAGLSRCLQVQSKACPGATGRTALCKAGQAQIQVGPGYEAGPRDRLRTGP